MCFTPWKREDKEVDREPLETWRDLRTMQDGNGASLGGKTHRRGVDWKK
jgi:hypothetical protein